MWPNKNFIFWYKHQPVNNFADGELAWVSFDMPCKCFDFKYFGNIQGNTSADNKIHPNEKPVALLKKLLQDISSKDELVFDPFGGSFSTFKACRQLGRDCVSCELDEYYYNIGKSTIEVDINTDFF